MVRGRRRRRARHSPRAACGGGPRGCGRGGARAAANTAAGRTLSLSSMLLYACSMVVLPAGSRTDSGVPDANLSTGERFAGGSGESGGGRGEWAARVRAGAGDDLVIRASLGAAG